MTVADACNRSDEWSWEQDKAFENALATYAEESSIWWEKIAEDVPGKTLEEIKQHYDLLEDDVNRIVSGCVPLPPYNSFDGSVHDGDEGAGKRGIRRLGHCDNDSNRGSKSSRSDQERRKGVAWTEDEHRLFLLGLDKYGKGDWRSISRNFVVTRTPTQVASHAQKYFIRLNSMNKDRRRSSIHDITSVGSGDISAQGPITGQSNGATAGVPSGKSAKHSHQHPTLPPGIGMYGESIGGPLVSAVGRPVNLASSTHMAYGITVPGAPMNMGHTTYPTSHTTTHR